MVSAYQKVISVQSVLFVVAELAECGSIYEYLHQKQMKPSLEQSLLWAKQIAEGITNRRFWWSFQTFTAHPFLLAGMNYLHQHDIIHRDLKSSNGTLCKSSLLACSLNYHRQLHIIH